MYMGDRWRPDRLHSSTYMWLPLSINGPDSVRLDNRINWLPNADTTGSWSDNIAETSYEGSNGIAAGGARVVSCNDCSGGNAMGYIGGPDRGTVTFEGITTEKAGVTTVRVKFANGDVATRYADVRVNGREPVRLAFVCTHGGTGSSSLVTHLETSGNTIVFEGVDGGWGPDIDGLFVPVE
jgi:hypothetical protein